MAAVSFRAYRHITCLSCNFCNNHFSYRDFLVTCKSFSVILILAHIFHRTPVCPAFFRHFPVLRPKPHCDVAEPGALEGAGVAGGGHWDVQFNHDHLSFLVALFVKSRSYRRFNRLLSLSVSVSPFIRLASCSAQVWQSYLLTLELSAVSTM